MTAQRLTRPTHYIYGLGGGSMNDHCPYSILKQFDQWFHWTRARIAEGRTPQEATMDTQFATNGWTRKGPSSYFMNMTARNCTIICHCGEVKI